MDDELHTLVSRFREATRTDADDPTRRAIWRRLHARTRAPVRAGSTVWVVGFALAAALLLVWALVDGFATARLAARDPAEQALDRIAAPATADVAVTADTIAPAATPPAPPTMPAAPASATSPGRGVPVQRPAPPSASPPVLAPDDALRREAELIQRARRSALAGDRDAARAAIARHAREFPLGTLAPERWVLDIELACAAGDREAAARAAAAFWAAYPQARAAQTLRARPCDAVTSAARAGQ